MTSYCPRCGNQSRGCSVVLPFRLIWSSCDHCATSRRSLLAQIAGFTRRVLGRPPAAPVRTGVSIAQVAPAARDEMFAFLASNPIEPASLDVVDEWLVAQDTRGGKRNTVATPKVDTTREADSELQLLFGDEWPAEIDSSEKKVPSNDELRGDTLLEKQTPVSRLVH